MIVMAGLVPAIYAICALPYCTNIDTYMISLTGMKRLPAFFYQTATGREPVREWLKQLDQADRKVIGEDIKDVEFS
jgi:hypothetical protein